MAQRTGLFGPMKPVKLALGLLAAATIVASAGPAAAVSLPTYSYTYDALGRLTSVTYNSGGHGYTTTYVYDATGNRTSVSTTTF